MEKDTNRIEAFSDGIFGVAITLLALEIGISEKGAHESITNQVFWQELIALWPKFFAYFNSFAAVLLMWMSHHKIFKLLNSTNTYVILANGLLLLIVALVPFPTKTVGEFIHTGAGAASIIFYTSYSVLISLSFCLLSLCIIKGGDRVASPENAVIIKKLQKGMFMGLLMNSAIFLMAFFAPYVALILNFCMWIFWAVLSHAAEKKTTIHNEN